MKDKLFAVLIKPNDEEYINRCFQDCGKIGIGGIIIGNYSAFPCKEENCPYEEKTIKLEDCKIETDRIVYDNIWLRKLTND